MEQCKSDPLGLTRYCKTTNNVYTKILNLARDLKKSGVAPDIIHKIDVSNGQGSFKKDVLFVKGNICAPNKKTKDFNGCTYALAYEPSVEIDLEKSTPSHIVLKNIYNVYDVFKGEKELQNQWRIAVIPQ